MTPHILNFLSFILFYLDNNLSDHSKVIIDQNVVSTTSIRCGPHDLSQSWKPSIQNSRWGSPASVWEVRRCWRHLQSCGEGIRKKPWICFRLLLQHERCCGKINFLSSLVILSLQSRWDKNIVVSSVRNILVSFEWIIAWFVFELMMLWEQGLGRWYYCVMQW